MQRRRSSAPSAKPLALALGLLTLSSCGIIRTTSSSEEDYQVVAVDWGPTQSTLEELIEREAPYASVLRGALDAELQLGAQSLTTRINATIVKGKTIYWSVVPFPLVEAARVWLTSEGVTVIDRMHGRYAQASFAELSRLLGFPLSYEDVEYLLLAKPNLGKSGMRLETFRPTEAMAVFLDRDKHMLHMELNRRARLSSVRYYQSTMHATPLVTASYGYSAESMQRGLPYTTTIVVQRSAGEGESKISLNWSGLSPHEGALPDLTIKIKPSYERIDLTELLKLLSKL